MIWTHRNGRWSHELVLSGRLARKVGTRGAGDFGPSTLGRVAYGSPGADPIPASAVRRARSAFGWGFTTAVASQAQDSTRSSAGRETDRSSVPSSLPPWLRLASRASARHLPPPGSSQLRSSTPTLPRVFPGALDGVRRNIQIWMGPPQRSLVGEWNTDAGGQVGTNYQRSCEEGFERPCGHHPYFD